MWSKSKAVFLISGAVALIAAEPPLWVSAELDDVEFRARLVRDVNEIQSRLGDDLDREFILVELQVRPLYNSEVILSRDDFLLRSYRNNERSQAQSPDRIAGEAVLVLGEGAPGEASSRRRTGPSLVVASPAPDCPAHTQGPESVEASVEASVCRRQPSRNGKRDPWPIGLRPSSYPSDPLASRSTDSSSFRSIPSTKSSTSSSTTTAPQASARFPSNPDRSSSFYPRWVGVPRKKHGHGESESFAERRIFALQ